VLVPVDVLFVKSKAEQEAKRSGRTAIDNFRAVFFFIRASMKWNEKFLTSY
jgi:hypothetical protein